VARERATGRRLEAQGGIGLTAGAGNQQVRTALVRAVDARVERLGARVENVGVLMLGVPLRDGATVTLRETRPAAGGFEQMLAARMEPLGRVVNISRRVRQARPGADRAVLWDFDFVPR
jgi:hypothetical protein